MSSPLYLHVTLKVRMDGYHRFCEGMAKQVPIIESYGWKLIGAWVTTVGRLHTVIDIWEIPDANAYAEVMKKVAERPDYPAFWKLLEETLEEEVVTMVQKVPYAR
ncbi:NIPSNAP family protein [Emcibacter sp. SYSU 3D8]|uniref:NIPSNAP family protein n=1 Tax=Emcibacter sp. SYSU 3D8 TaxID=3133969 RepID=UPI0031FE6913